MARIRTIKPEMAKHELLFELELELRAPVRFAWAMLFTQCDREGRFKWRPRALKSDILPYDDIDFSRVLDAWATRGLLVKYRVGREWYGCIPTFRKHQAINARESASELPSPEEAEEVSGEGTEEKQQVADASATRQPRVGNASATRDVRARGEGKGREGKGKEGEQQQREVDTSTSAPASDLGPYFVLLAAAGYDVMQVKGNAKCIAMLRTWQEEGITAQHLADTLEILKTRDSTDWKNSPLYLDGPIHDLVNGSLKKGNGKRPPWANVPRVDNLLQPFIDQYGFKQAPPGETYDQTRQRLHREVQLRAQREGIAL